MIIGYGTDANKTAEALSAFGFDMQPEKKGGRYDAFIYVSAKNCDLAEMVSKNSGIFLLNVSTMSPEDAAVILHRRAVPLKSKFIPFH